LKPCRAVDGSANHGEIEALGRADIAVGHLADMQTKPEVEPARSARVDRRLPSARRRGPLPLRRRTPDVGNVGRFAGRSRARRRR
jgi:hypothetical protein